MHCPLHTASRARPNPRSRGCGHYHHPVIIPCNLSTLTLSSSPRTFRLLANAWSGVRNPWRTSPRHHFYEANHAITIRVYLLHFPLRNLGCKCTYCGGGGAAGGGKSCGLVGGQALFGDLWRCIYKCLCSLERELHSYPFLSCYSSLCGICTFLAILPLFVPSWKVLVRGTYTAWGLMMRAEKAGVLMWGLN